MGGTDGRTTWAETRVRAGEVARRAVPKGRRTREPIAISRGAVRWEVDRPASRPAAVRFVWGGRPRRKGWARLVGGVGGRRLRAGDARTAPAGCCVVFGGLFGSFWLAAEVRGERVTPRPRALGRGCLAAVLSCSLASRQSGSLRLRADCPIPKIQGSKYTSSSRRSMVEQVNVIVIRFVLTLAR